LVPLLSSSSDQTGYDPLTDHDMLGRLYDAFHGPDLLAKRAYRSQMLQYLPTDKLKDLAGRIGVDTDLPHPVLSEKVAGINWANNQDTAKFLSFFGYPREYIPDEFVSVATVEEVVPYGAPLKVLKDYQVSVFFRAASLLEHPCARLMIQMPTGSGKTRTAMEIVASYLNAGNKVVLWLANKEELCDQAATAFAEVWRHVGQHPVSLVRCWNEHTPTLPPESPAMIVAGFPKAYSMHKNGAQSPKASLVVIDEAHMAIAPTYSAVVKWAKDLSARVVGLSATPGRTVDTELLVDFFHGEIIGIEEGDQSALEFLQGHGILANVELEPINTHLSFTLTQGEWESLSTKFDYPKAFLERVAIDQQRNRIIAEKLSELAENTSKALVFACSLQQSHLLCALMICRGIPAAHIDGNTSHETRRAAIAKFRRGEIRFLFNYEVLSTGFDVPGIDAVVVARPTLSRVLYQQMVGRGLRGPAVGGTESVRVISVVDNIINAGTFEDAYECFADEWCHPQY